MERSNFPTASSVPFPYSPPYSVQRELMSAILTSLRQCSENAPSASSPATGPNHSNAAAAPSKRKAPIIMVESPTGTGKSLSLACAAMAWLRYREQEDLTEPADSVADAAESPSNNQTDRKGSTKYDWLNSWQPSESDGRTADRASRTAPSTTTPQNPPASMRSFAISNRAALDGELNKIRARLETFSNVAAFSSDSSSIHPNAERSRRENLLRTGISRAMVAERKRSRGLLRDGKVVSGDKKRRLGERRAAEETDDFMLDEYHSEEEDKSTHRSDSDDDENDNDDCTLSSIALGGKKRGHENLSTKAMLHGSNLDGSGYRRDPEKNARSKMIPGACSDSAAVGDVTPGSGLRKIIYAARTHSQLSQFVGELRRTHWAKSVKVVALGSRAVLCSNDDVLYVSPGDKTKGRRSEVEITEMCLDMQKSNKNNRSIAKGDAKSSSCPFLESSEAVSTLAMHSLVRPSDIEDVVSLGKATHTCSYYSSRQALAAAEVVVLPYNTLLSDQARQSIGLSLKNALVVIDEAHNLPEALRGVSSCTLSLPVIEAAMAQLSRYTQRYSGRLAGRNLYYLGQIRKVLIAMAKFLKLPPPSRSSSANEKTEECHEPSISKKEMLAAVDLMFRLKLDNLNLFTLLRYIKRSGISQKLLGFVNHSASVLENDKKETIGDSEQREAGGKNLFMSRHVSALSVVETFLKRLTGTSREGKVIVEWPTNEMALITSSSERDYPMFRYVQIHSGSLLDNMIDEAHAIILAGGTLRPFSHVAAELFVHNDEVMKAALYAEAKLSQKFDSTTSLSMSPNNGSRPSSSFVHITPQLTAFTCSHVIPPSNVLTAYLSYGPSGLKLDFRHGSRSSNDMIDELGRTLLNLCNVAPSGFVVFLPSYSYESAIFQRWRVTGMLSQIHARKPIHREPKSSRDLDVTLSRYSEEASSSTRGAILFSVMGGKMSEGINFANEMARTVFVVGLPFPDITDPVLIEKMQSLDLECKRLGTGITGQAYYQNLCMRTVNQSVGRAIRHANDYAAIVLADFRYVSDLRIWKGLPAWSRSGIPKQSTSTFGNVLKSIRLFFAVR